MDLKYLAKEYDEEEDPFKRLLVARALVNEILQGPVNDETSNIGVGPVDLDVDMARRHGWSEEQIERAFETLKYVSRVEGTIAELNHPELFEEDEWGNSIFVGKGKGEEE